MEKSMQPEENTPDRAELMQTIQRCAAAYHRVMADLPKGSLRWDVAEFQQRAFLAFSAHLPVLCDLASIQLYIACIAQGAAIGAIDPVDAGRFCHIAQTAMSAWKLANLTVPAAQAREKREQQKAQKQTPLPSKGNHFQDGEGPKAQEQGRMARENATPLPPKGNHAEEKTSQPEDFVGLYIATKLPDWETQVALYQSLRKRGVEVPTDGELRADPTAALHYVETARWYIRGSQPAAAAPAPPTHPQPAPAPQEKPAQAA
jgi:hypothetical protein